MPEQRHATPGHPQRRSSRPTAHISARGLTCQHAGEHFMRHGALHVFVRRLLGTIHNLHSLLGLRERRRRRFDAISISDRGFIYLV
jgi:hypothetical protein